MLIISCIDMCLALKVLTLIFHDHIGLYGTYLRMVRCMVQHRNMSKIIWSKILQKNKMLV